MRLSISPILFYTSLGFLMAEQKEKLIIIGSGPAALTAAIYAARARLDPLVIEGLEPGGQLMGTSDIENWPGTERIMGPQLMIQMRDHAKALGARLIQDEVTATDLKNRPFSLTLESSKTLTCDALIIATGAQPKKLQCPGEDEYWGRGVTTCAVCDGAFYRNKKVIVVGGGDSAMENASFLTHFTQDITVIHLLDKLTASAAMQERVLKDPSIKIIYESTVSAIEGNGKNITHAVITNQKTKASEKITVDGVFIAIGLIPNTRIFGNLLEKTPSGHIKILEYTHTSIPGVFAAGDVADMRYRQAITSAGTGCMAALDAERFLKEAIL